jgi:hypothetical protein
MYQSYIGEFVMELNEQNQVVIPDWASTSGIEFWQPDELFIEWITFLYGIWETVEYL